MNWAEKLKDIMRRNNVTQKDLADKIDISQQQLSRMMQGDVKLSTLKRMLDALGVELTDFFSEKDVAIKTKPPIYDEDYRKTHVHGYLRIGEHVVEVNSMKELKQAVIQCEVNYLI